MPPAPGGQRLVAQVTTDAGELDDSHPVVVTVSWANPKTQRLARLYQRELMVGPDASPTDTIDVMLPSWPGTLTLDVSIPSEARTQLHVTLTL